MKRKMFTTAAAAVFSITLCLTGCASSSSAAAETAAPSSEVTSSPEAARFWDSAVTVSSGGKKQAVVKLDKAPADDELADWYDALITKKGFDSAVIVTDSKKNTGIYADSSHIYTGADLKENSSSHMYSADTSSADETYTVKDGKLVKADASASASAKSGTSSTKSSSDSGKSSSGSTANKPASSSSKSSSSSSSSSKSTASNKSASSSKSSSGASKSSSSGNSTASNNSSAGSAGASSGRSSSNSSGNTGSSSSGSSKKQTCTVVPAQTHVVHHDAVTHQETVTVVDQAAHDDLEVTGTVIIDGNGHQFSTYAEWSQHSTDMTVEAEEENAQPGDPIWSCGQWHSENVFGTVHHDAVTHQETKTVVDKPAWDETVVDSPAKTVCH